MTVASQRGTASPMLRESWVVGVKVYGRRPSILSEIKKIINEARIVAHLWPPRLIGRKSWCTNCLMNQFCRVRRWFFTQREEGAGKRTQGKVRARAIRGIPRYTGLINWSKKLSVMVSFRGLSLVFERPGMLARWGMCEQ